LKKIRKKEQNLTEEIPSKVGLDSYWQTNGSTIGLIRTCFPKAG